MAVFLNKNSFHRIHKLPPFYIKTTFARIDFLRQDERLVDKKGTHNVKFITKTRQNEHVVNTHEWPTAPKTYKLATPSASGCRACYSHTLLYIFFALAMSASGCRAYYLHTASCKRRSNLPFTAGFSTCRECMEQLPPS